MKKLAVTSKAKRQKIIVVTTSFVLVALIVVTTLSELRERFVINTTPSMPLGIYRITSNPIKRGAIVGACIPESLAILAKERSYLGEGSCSNGLRPVMKHLVALSGDFIEVGLRGVSVNKEAIANTRVLLRDAKGRSLPNQIGKHKVYPNQYWLISNSDIGCFDSRYFGPVKEILGVVEPFITKSTICSTSVFRSLLRCSGDSQ